MRGVDHLVTALLNQQVFGAGNQVDLGQGSLQQGGQLFGFDCHGVRMVRTGPGLALADVDRLEPRDQQLGHRFGQVLAQVLLFT